MPASRFFRHLASVFHGAGSIVKQSLRLIAKDPHVLAYPYLAVIFILLTFPLISAVVLPLWHRIEQPAFINDVTQAAPSHSLAHLGLVTFSVFYGVFVTSFFACAMSAVTLAKLEERPSSTFYGLRVMLSRFFRIAKFALLAIFFFPIGLFAQRQNFKSLRGIFEAITSSFSLSMNQLAPVVISGHKGVFLTVQDALNTLGHFWQESLVIRIGTFLSVLVLGSISLLPKLIEHYWFNGLTAHIVSWIATFMLGIASYVTLRVLSTISTTTLYHRAKTQKK